MGKCFKVGGNAKSQTGTVYEVTGIFYTRLSTLSVAGTKYVDIKKGDRYYTRIVEKDENGNEFITYGFLHRDVPVFIYPESEGTE